MLKLDDLHDAILESVTIQSRAATVALTFLPIAYAGAPAAIRLVAHKWRLFSCPKRDPWGVSSEWRVNESRGPFQIEEGLTRIELEMQSGDTIEVQAQRIERVDVEPGS
jgi:hypothetical protein